MPKNKDSKAPVNLVGGLSKFDKDVLKAQRKLTKKAKRRSKKISKSAQDAAAKVIGG